ncbi:alpha/beta hydrolase family protein [Bradyrhizobium guangzhouense]|uniref:Alpha/beta hydrolase n=1 Tax=Bradyrhizobium guangzhouense TaxID=1325095 RepID=A0AAE5X786_9BRAD|nr:alpha/beta family hydrolase [Bradyrhizobium guangzhouense]QAU49969.1 alpha/beta hydrolase [Bradyrhizobium guangzhouense]RXH12572.1 alpha/beta hydrolase [Bradyrhizobium guangzhouense]
MAVKTQELKLDIERIGPVSAILMQPANARACYVLAHGAGTDMRHASMDKIALGLSERGIATFRFNFPYMENKQGRPDQPAVAHATIRAAVEEGARLCPGLKLIAGGKSFGGRMTSQAEAKAPLPNVKGLAFLGFPLHADKKPSIERAEHLARVEIPMLFLQGTRDGLADLGLLKPVLAKLGTRAMLHEIEGADHSFAVLKKSGRTNDEALAEVLDTLATWIDQLA